MVTNVATRRRQARVLLVDDHPVIRRGMAQLIANEQDLEVCGEASDAAEALQKTIQTHPDLIVIDITLGHSNGLELIKQIKAYDDSIKMIVASTHADELYAERSLRAGALGYINKDAEPGKLLGALRQVLEGRVVVSEATSERLLSRAIGGTAADDSAIGHLSDRELEIFDLMGHGVTTREIAARLHLSIKTIESHRENIKAKMDVRSSTELSRLAMQWVAENE